MRFVKGAPVPMNAQAKSKIIDTLVIEVCTTCVPYFSVLRQLLKA